VETTQAGTAPCPYPTLPQLSGCRRAAVLPGHHRHLRGDPEVVPEIRPSVGPSAPTPPAQAGRRVAPGRGVFDHQRRTALPVASGRSGWPHPGYARPKPSKPEGGEEVFLQATEGVDVRAAGDHRPRVSPRHGPTIPELARSQGDASSIKSPIPLGDTPSCLMSGIAHNKLTMPYRGMRLS
jgi:hypothetical protein